MKVRLFARARDLARADSIAVDVPAGATVGELRRRIGEAYPALAKLLGRSALAVNDEFADDALPLPVNAEVALLPPVSGGCPRDDMPIEKILTRQTTLADYAAAWFGNRLTGRPKEKWDRFAAEVEAAMITGDQLWEWETDRFHELAGTAGLAIVREGQVLKTWELWKS